VPKPDAQFLSQSGTPDSGQDQHSVHCVRFGHSKSTILRAGFTDSRRRSEVLFPQLIVGFVHHLIVVAIRTKIFH
jgi:hypothetical protein